jgi:hypothetical protein
MRNRRGLNRIGILAIALIIAIGAVGVTYGAWVDDIYLDASVYTGTTSSVLNCAAPHSTEVSCTKSDATLHITVAATVAAPTPAGSYNHNFTVLNTGDLPVKVNNIVVSTLPSGVHVSTTGVVAGSVIDPGPAASGTVNIILDTAITANISFDVAFTIVRWNQ